MSNSITVKAELADKDRKLLTDVLAALTKASGKVAPAASSKNAPADDDTDTETSTDDEFEGGDGDGDDGAEEEDEGDDDDGEKAPERADVHKAMKAYSVACGSAAEAIKVMAKNSGGCEALSKLDPKHFAKVIAAMEAATKKAKKK